MRNRQVERKTGERENETKDSSAAISAGVFRHLTRNDSEKLVEKAQEPDEEYDASKEVTDSQGVRCDGLHQGRKLEVTEEFIEPKRDIRHKKCGGRRNDEAEDRRHDVCAGVHLPLCRGDARDACEDKRDDAGEDGKHRRRADYPVVHFACHLAQDRHREIEKRHAEKGVGEHKPCVHGLGAEHQDPKRRQGKRGRCEQDGKRL